MPASLVLRQAGAPSAEREIRLDSEWAFYAEDGERRDLLLAYPLPRARTGPRDFLLFLCVPARAEEIRIASQDSGPSFGFLIQEVGRLKGKTTLRSGTVRVDAPLLRPGALDLEFDLTGDDGTRIIGRARVAQNERELSAFRSRFRADIELAARSGPDQPASAETPPPGDASASATVRPTATTATSVTSE